MKEIIDIYNRYADVIKKHNFLFDNLRIIKDEDNNEYRGVFYFFNDAIDWSGSADLIMVIDKKGVYIIYKGYTRWTQQPDYYLSFPTIDRITDCVNEYFEEGNLWLSSENIDLDEWLRDKIEKENKE